MSALGYELQEISVRPDQLLLDPNNPRLRNEAGAERLYTDEQLTSPELQARLLNALLQEEHEVKRLRGSMCENGYVNIDSIVVRRLSSVDKYLVIEGNRRTAAAKSALESSEKLKPNALASLQSIPVKNLVCDDEKYLSRMTEFILSIRHIYGVKEWAPMQRAHSIHNAYVTRFNADVGTKAFRYVAEIGKSVALTMNLQPAEVSKAIAIYRVFHDMQKEGYSIRSDHYSLLEMAISRPRMAADVFGFEPKSSTFSVEGMELFHNLCVEDHCPIRNPKQFREMYKVWKETGKRAVIEVSENASSLDDVSRRAFDREMQKDAENKLQRAKDILDKISIDQIRGTISEQQLVSEIHNLLVAKLIPAVGSDG